jgi:hypothetical protein
VINYPPLIRLVWSVRTGWVCVWYCTPREADLVA